MNAIYGEEQIILEEGLRRGRHILLNYVILTHTRAHMMQVKGSNLEYEICLLLSNIHVTQKNILQYWM